MTKEEILAMEVEAELDALVVEQVLGWRIGHKEWEKSRLYYDTYPWVDADGHWHGLLKCSTDISAAWQVAEKVLSLGFSFSLSSQITRDKKLNWECNIYKTVPANYPVRSITAPEAICKAALLANLGGNNELNNN